MADERGVHPASVVGMRAYGRILRSPNMGPLFAATLLARLPIGINGLAIVLFLRTETGSFAVAGAAAGALALGAGIGAPVAARLVDSLGKGVLVALAAAHAGGLAALVALGFADAPTATLMAAALVTGIATPPVSSVMRALYPRMLREPALVQGAYALDSVLTETLFVIGPLITAVLVLLVAPAAALVVSAVAGGVGVALFLAALPHEERHRAATVHPEGSRSRLGALRAPGIRTLVLSMVPVGFAFGSIEVALPAFADSHDSPGMAGVLIAIWSIASAAGGLVYGARERRSRLEDVHVRMGLLVPVSFVPLALADSIVAMALIVIPAGLFIAPVLATRNELAGVVAPPGAETEAFTWPLTALIAGVALGAAAAGVLVDSIDWRAPMLAAIAAAAIGAAVAVVRRNTLRAPAAEPATA
jgi:MFS family permease